MFSKEMEALIAASIEDGILTDQEKRVLVKRAEKEGIDLDELDVYIQSLLQKRHQAEAEEDARNDRQSKMGSLKKCPKCGQTVQVGWAACPMCGFAFSVEETSSAYNDFCKKISEMDISAGSFGVSRVTGKWQKKVQAKANYIETYPVPNNRMALLEFLAQTKILGDVNGEPPVSRFTSMMNIERPESELFALSYWRLFEKCISISKRSFTNDPDFEEYFEYYDQQKAKEKKGGLFGFFR